MMKGECTAMRHPQKRHPRCNKAKTLLLAAGLTVFSASSLAANQTCEAGRIAQAGADAAYKQEVERANNAAQSETSTADSLGQCLGSMSVSLKLPQFPSIGDIIEKVKNETCSVIRSKVNEKWGSLGSTTLDPWAAVSSRLPDTSGIIPNASSTNVPLNSPATASGAGEDANSDAFPFHL
ncbi:hypothetical protein C4Z25_014955 [Enterobacter hormaechei subsp. steigerwaltii]|nr:hypothetical protein C4Z25_014955 [Enterobacter hormaechei subsp. steigerwaltii]